MITIQRLKKTTHIIFLFCVACHSLLLGEEASQCPRPPLSLCDLITTALENNPETRNAWLKAQQAASLYQKSKSSCYPTISFNSNLTHGRSYKFINGPETTFTTASADISLNYLLFDFGERSYGIESAKAALEAAEWRTNWTFQKIISKVLTHAYEYWNAHGILLARQETLKDLLTNLQAAEEQYKTGLKSITDVYAVKTTISDMRMNIANQRANVEIAIGKLALSLGYNADEWIEVLPLVKPLPFDLSDTNLRKLIETAQVSRADIAAKRAELNQKMAAYKKVTKSTNPKLSFSGKAGYQQFLDDKDHGYTYRGALNLDFPIFNGFDTVYQKRIAYADMLMTEVDLEQLELDISLEVLTALRRLEASQQTMGLSEENLKNATMTYEGVLDKYRVGTQSIFDLNRAQQMLSDARIKHSDARTQFYLAISQLALSSGTLETLSEGICLE